MFESLSWLTGGRRRPAHRPDSPFRPIETRRGTYFVRWEPEAVSALIEAEGLRADDLDVQNPAARKRLARELLLLGLQDELRRGPRPTDSTLSRLARSLIRAGRPSGRGAAAAVCFSPAT